MHCEVFFRALYAKKILKSVDFHVVQKIKGFFLTRIVYERATWSRTVVTTYNYDSTAIRLQFDRAIRPLDQYRPLGEASKASALGLARAGASR